MCDIFITLEYCGAKFKIHWEISKFWSVCKLNIKLPSSATVGKIQTEITNLDESFDEIGESARTKTSILDTHVPWVR